MRQKKSTVFEHSERDLQAGSKLIVKVIKSILYTAPGVSNPLFMKWICRRFSCQFLGYSSDVGFVFCGH